MKTDDLLIIWAAIKVIELELKDLNIKDIGPMAVDKRRMSIRYMKSEVAKIKEVIQKHIGRME